MPTQVGNSTAAMIPDTALRLCVPTEVSQTKLGWSASAWESFIGDSGAGLSTGAGSGGTPQSASRCGSWLCGQSERITRSDTDGYGVWNRRAQPLAEAGVEGMPSGPRRLERFGRTNPTPYDSASSPLLPVLRGPLPLPPRPSSDPSIPDPDAPSPSG